MRDIKPYAAVASNHIAHSLYPCLAGQSRTFARSVTILACSAPVCAPSDRIAPSMEYVRHAYATIVEHRSASSVATLHVHGDLTRVPFDVLSSCFEKVSDRVTRIIHWRRIRPAALRRDPCERESYPACFAHQCVDVQQISFMVCCDCLATLSRWSACRRNYSMAVYGMSARLWNACDCALRSILHRTSHCYPCASSGRNISPLSCHA